MPRPALSQGAPAAARRTVHFRNVPSAVPTSAPFFPTPGKCVGSCVHSVREPQLLRSVREAAQRAGSLEEALRAALQRICAATGWQAGRVEFAQRATENAPRTIWYLEQPDRLDTLKGVAERRRHSDGGGLAGKVLREGAPQWRPGSEDGAGAVFAFPAVARRRTVAAVEFFSTAAEPPDDALLSRITHACAELGRVIEEKPAQEMLRKAERGYRDLFESVSEALIVVDPRTGTI